MATDRGDESFMAADIGHDKLAFIADGTPYLELPSLPYYLSITSLYSSEPCFYVHPGK